MRIFHHITLILIVLLGLPGFGVCVCVRVCVCSSVCVCVYVCERERERLSLCGGNRRCCGLLLARERTQVLGCVCVCVLRVTLFSGAFRRGVLGVVFWQALVFVFVCVHSWIIFQGHDCL